jgi:hypothetical protein
VEDHFGRKKRDNDSQSLLGGIVSEEFLPLVSESPLPHSASLDVHPNQPGEQVVGILDSIKIQSFGACDGCSKESCDRCGIGKLLGIAKFHTIREENFEVRLWVQQIAPLTKYTRIDLFQTWRTTPAEVVSRLNQYIGLPFLISGLSRRYPEEATLSVSRISCLTWEAINAEIAEREKPPERPKVVRPPVVPQPRHVPPRRTIRMVIRESDYNQRLFKIYEEEKSGFSENDREYYRTTWGFDPISDRIMPPAQKHSMKYYFNEDIPLENDPELAGAGVSLHARVEVNWNNESHNRIVFAQGRRETAVNCIHTIIHVAPLQELAKITQDEFRDRVRSTEGRTAVLPPWEHFTALKSFASGLAAAGVLNQVFPRNFSHNQEDSLPLEMNPILLKQLRDALKKIANSVVQRRNIEMLGDLIDQVPEDWLISRWHLLNGVYAINDIFSNNSLVSSLDDAIQRKLLRIYLFLLRISPDINCAFGSSFLPVVLTEDNIKSITEIDVLYNCFFAIASSWRASTWEEFVAIPCNLMSRALFLCEDRGDDLDPFLKIIETTVPLN